MLSWQLGNWHGDFILCLGEKYPRKCSGACSGEVSRGFPVGEFPGNSPKRNVRQFWRNFPQGRGIFTGERPGELSGKGVRIPMLDYKFLPAAVMICVTLVNAQTDRLTHTDSFWPTILWLQPTELKRTKSNGISLQVVVAMQNLRPKNTANVDTSAHLLTTEQLRVAADCKTETPHTRP